MVASAWPAVTVWPTLTLTAVTLPDDPKFRLAVLAGSMVPDEDTVLVMVPVETVWTLVVVVMVGAALELFEVSSVVTPAPIPAPTTTSATTARLDRLLYQALVPDRIHASLVGRLPDEHVVPIPGTDFFLSSPGVADGIQPRHVVSHVAFFCGVTWNLPWRAHSGGWDCQRSSADAVFTSRAQLSVNSYGRAAPSVLSAIGAVWHS